MIFISIARDLSSIPSCSLLVKRLPAGLEVGMESFSHGLRWFVCSSAPTCPALAGGPRRVLGCPLFAWLLLLCAGIRQVELSQEEDSKGKMGFN